MESCAYYEVKLLCGRSSVVERHVANVNVVSSNLIARLREKVGPKGRPFRVTGWRLAKRGMRRWSAAKPVTYLETAPCRREGCTSRDSWRPTALAFGDLPDRLGALVQNLDVGVIHGRDVPSCRFHSGCSCERPL